LGCFWGSTWMALKAVPQVRYFLDRTDFNCETLVDLADPFNTLGCETVATFVTVSQYRFSFLCCQLSINLDVSGKIAVRGRAMLIDQPRRFVRGRVENGGEGPSLARTFPEVCGLGLLLFQHASSATLKVSIDPYGVPY